MIFSCASHSDIGHRDNQEDACGCVQTPTGLLAALADGIGGNAAGEVASRVAVNTVLKSALPSLQQRFEAAHAEIRNIGKAQPQARGLGCTLTVALLQNSTLFWCHLGDSRLYLYRSSVLKRLTSDHTVAGAMLHYGLMTEEGFEKGEAHQGLLQYAGMDIERNKLLPVDCGKTTLLPGDVMLLTSDGVHGALTSAKLSATVHATRDKGPRSIARALVQAALAAGGQDNATCVCVVVP